MQTQIRKTGWWQNLLYGAGLLALLVVLAPGLALGADLTLDGGSTLTVPPDGPLAYDNEFIGDLSAGTINQSGSTNTVNSILYLGNDTTGTGTYTLSSSGTLSASSEVVGNSGIGTFTQTGNTINTATYIGLGALTNGSGTYELTSGSLTTTNQQYIGVQGTGTFTQTGGTNEVLGELILAAEPGSTGTYNLNGGSLSALTQKIGPRASTGTFIQGAGTNNESENLILGGDKKGDTFFAGTGTYTQTGGINTISANLYVGLYPGSIGTYELKGGGLSAPQQHIGLSGTGLFTQTGASTNLTDYLILGESGGTGTYNLQGGNLSTLYQWIGYGLGNGTFTQDGGINIAYYNIVLAVDPGSSGTYNLRGGSLSARTIEVNSGGTFNQEGGSLSALSIDIKGGGSFNVKNEVTTVTGNVVNDGTVKTTNASVTWNGTFTNNGVYMSDPATQTFSNLTVGTGGYIVAHTGDLFKVSGNFVNNSTQNSQWNTAAATLQFINGTSSDHSLSITGPDNGPTGGPGDFSWATIKIDSGQTVHLLGSSDAALYVKTITGVDLTGGGGIAHNIYGSMSETLNIYYDPTQFDNMYLGGLTYTFESGSGELIPTPLPASALLLGSGLLGLGLLGYRRKRG
jgi:hypothetical protein